MDLQDAILVAAGFGLGWYIVRHKMHTQKNV